MPLPNYTSKQQVTCSTLQFIKQNKVKIELDNVKKCIKNIKSAQSNIKQPFR